MATQNGQQPRGIKLQGQDKLLWEISRRWTSFETVKGLAIQLMEHRGLSFVQAQTAPGGVPAVQNIALDVLLEWVKTCPRQAYGGKLLEILSNKDMDPSLAEEFADHLVPSEEERISVLDPNSSTDGASSIKASCQPITRDHLFALESTLAVGKWYRIARRLKHEEKPGQPYFFEEAEIDEIRRNKKDQAVECFHAFVLQWQAASNLHTVGPFYKALKQEGLGGTAQKVFGNINIS